MEIGKKPSPRVILRLIQLMKDNLKQDPVFLELLDKLNEDPSTIDYIPVRFGDIDVSARTDGGVITLNWQLLEDCDFKTIVGYLLHEIKHALDQLQFPTKSADDGDYLKNPDEVSAFQHQVKYLDEQFGGDKAEKYVDQVLDHHDVKDKKERKEKEENLMKLVED